MNSKWVPNGFSTRTRERMVPHGDHLICSPSRKRSTNEPHDSRVPAPKMTRDSPSAVRMHGWTNWQPSSFFFPEGPLALRAAYPSLTR